MPANELRELGEEQLRRKLQELTRELDELRDAVASGKEKNHARLRMMRREMARIRTVLRETSPSTELRVNETPAESRRGRDRGAGSEARKARKSRGA